MSEVGYSIHGIEASPDHHDQEKRAERREKREERRDMREERRKKKSVQMSRWRPAGDPVGPLAGWPREREERREKRGERRAKREERREERREKTEEKPKEGARGPKEAARGPQMRPPELPVPWRHGQQKGWPLEGEERRKNREERRDKREAKIAKREDRRDKLSG